MLAQSWRHSAGANSARNSRAVIFVAHQVAAAFDQEARTLVQKLTDGGGENAVHARVVLRLRPELEMMSSLYETACDTAASSLGGKGRQLLGLHNKELQKNIRIIQTAVLLDHEFVETAQPQRSLLSMNELSKRTQRLA